ncbi:MAG: DUF4261 domain-containing protein [Vulcanimicrobiota bacterium]
MAKGLFTQGIALLFEQAPNLDRLAEAVGLTEARRREDTQGWEVSSRGLLFPYRPEVNGWLDLDVVDLPWPDSMGGPQEQPALFAAWSMGHFGPFAWPGALQRAQEQAWDWPDQASQVVGRHGAFVRLRLTYAIGIGPDDPILPEGLDALEELRFLTELLPRLLELPGALAYFNPNADLVLDLEGVRRKLEGALQDDRFALDLWRNIRFFRLSEETSMMDTVGLAQLGLPDLEVTFPSSADPDEIAWRLANLAGYMADQGDVLLPGNSVDGPDSQLWWVERVEESELLPPRRLVRLLADQA